MAANKTMYLRNKLLNHVLRGSVGGTGFTQPSAVYLALYTGDPFAGGTEVAGPVGVTGYARQLAAFTDATNGSATNVTSIVFGPNLVSWGNISYCVLFDAPTGGNVLYDGRLTVGVLNWTATGGPLELEPGAVIITDS